MCVYKACAGKLITICDCTIENQSYLATCKIRPNF